MKKIPIWLFIINLSVPYYSTNAQELVKKEVVDSLNKRKKKSFTIRFGMDLSKPLIAELDKDFFGLELVGDIKLFNEFYGAIEIGNERKTQQSELINFTTTGTYIKLGFDYNMFKNWKGMSNAIYLGMRIANSFHKQKINEYIPYQIDHYWISEVIKKGPEIREYDTLSARWIEFLAGIKVKMIKNIYMGFSLRLNRLMSDTRPENFDNLHIPGFNKKTDENVWGAGFNYTLTYSIPVKI